MIGSTHDIVGGSAASSADIEVLEIMLRGVSDRTAADIQRRLPNAATERLSSIAIHDNEGKVVTHSTAATPIQISTFDESAAQVIKAFRKYIAQGDVFIVKDTAHSSLFSDTARIVSPIVQDELVVGYIQSSCSWFPLVSAGQSQFNLRGGSPALKITPIRVAQDGVAISENCRLLASNCSQPEQCLRELNSYIDAHRRAQSDIDRMLSMMKPNWTVAECFSAIQNRSEVRLLTLIGSQADGVWSSSTQFYFHGGGELRSARINLDMIIEGDGILFDFSRSDCDKISRYYNFNKSDVLGVVVASLKKIMPDIPLNEGFYRPIRIRFPGDYCQTPDALSNSAALFDPGILQLVGNAVTELWASVLPKRAVAHSYGSDYVDVHGTDGREPREGLRFHFGEGIEGGRGAASGEDGVTAGEPEFGYEAHRISLEEHELQTPFMATAFELLIDTGGPGEWRGGAGLEKGFALRQSAGATAAFFENRQRMVMWGLRGGLPAVPVTALNEGLCESEREERWIGKDEILTRRSGGGGGLGDPLNRDCQKVCDDVADGYVSIERAAKDYGVIVRETDRELALYEVDEGATEHQRDFIRRHRRDWLQADPHEIAIRYRAGEYNAFDLVRRFGVLLRWNEGEVLEQETASFRAEMLERAAPYWAG